MIVYASRCSTLAAAVMAMVLSVVLAITFSHSASAQDNTDTVQVNAKPASDIKASNSKESLNPIDTKLVNNAQANTAQSIESTLNSGGLKSDLKPADSLFQNTKTAPSNSIVQGGSVLQVLLSLAFIIVLIYAGAWYFRRMQLGSGTGQSMRVVSAISVGTRERVVLVQVGEQQLVLGVAPGRVNLLQQIDQGSGQLVEPNNLPDSKAVMTKSFAKILAERIPGSKSTDADKQ